jgi:hypothetical protein
LDGLCQFAESSLFKSRAWLDHAGGDQIDVDFMNLLVSGCLGGRRWR